MEDQVLTALRRVQGVAAAYVVDADGVVSASGGSGGDAQGRLLAALAGALRQATGDLQLGDLAEFLVEGSGGALMAGSLPRGRTAIVVTDARANLGLVRVELRRLRRNA